MSNIFITLGFKKGHAKIVFIFAFLVLLSAGIVSYLNTYDLINEDKNTSLYLSNIETIETLRDRIEEAQTGRHFYYITGNKSYLKPFELAANSVDSLYSVIKNLNYENKNTLNYLDTLSVLVKNRFALLNTGIAIQDKGGKGSDAKIIELTNEGINVQKSILELIARMKTDAKNHLAYSTETVNTKAKFASFVLVAGVALSLFLFFIAFKLRGINRNEEDDPDSPIMSRSELDKLVKERTAEISQINQRLYKEIDRHKLTEQALKNSTHEYRMLFEQAHDAIIIFKPEDEIILDVNHRACDVYGIDRQHFVGMSMKTLSKNIKQGEKHIQATVEIGFYHNFETVHYRKDGSEMLMEINASIVNFHGQQVILSINRDITHRVTSIKL